MALRGEEAEINRCGSTEGRTFLSLCSGCLRLVCDCLARLQYMAELAPALSVITTNVCRKLGHLDLNADGAAGGGEQPAASGEQVGGPCRGLWGPDVCHSADVMLHPLCRPRHMLCELPQATGRA